MLASKRICAGGLFLLFCCAFLSSCTAAPQRETKTFTAMDTVFSVTLYGAEKTSTEAQLQKEIRRLDALFSTEAADSLPARAASCKSGVKIALSADEASLMSAAATYNQLSGGLFDVTVGSLKLLWNEAAQKNTLPTAAAVEAAQKMTGSDCYAFSEAEQTLTVLKSPLRLDFGGLAKGFAADRLLSILKKNQVSGFVSLGGCIAACGKKPDGSAFRFALRTPEAGRQDTIGMLTMPSDGVLSTSGDYERFYEIDGVQYSQILNPKTGRPADSDFLAATVFSKDGTMTDFASTALMLLKEEQAVDFVRAQKLSALLVTRKKEILITGDLLPYFEQNTENKDYTLRELKR